MSQPAVIRSHIGWGTIGQVSSGVGHGLAGGALVGSSCSSDSLWRAGCLQADLGRQLNSVSFDTLVQLASGLSEQCVKKQHGLANVSEDA